MKWSRRKKSGSTRTACGQLFFPDKPGPRGRSGGGPHERDPDLGAQTKADGSGAQLCSKSRTSPIICHAQHTEISVLFSYEERMIYRRCG